MTPRPGAAATVILVFASAACAAAAPIPSASPASMPQPSGTLSERSPALDVAPGEPCAAVEEPRDLGRRHLQPGSDHVGAYSSDPPTSGPHDPRPIQPGIYDQPQPVPQLIHAMEHGAVVLWTGGLSPTQRDALASLAADLAGRGYGSLIVVPYPQLGVPIAMTAWGVLQMCLELDAPAIRHFVRDYYASGAKGHLACPAYDVPDIWRCHGPPR
jgi:hypothetical protein